MKHAKTIAYSMRSMAKTHILIKKKFENRTWAAKVQTRFVQISITILVCDLYCEVVIMLSQSKYNQSGRIIYYGTCMVD